MTTKQRSKTYTFVNFVYWVLFGVAIYFAYMNIAPYVVAVDKLSGDGINILSTLSSLPFIGFIFSFLAFGFNWIVGTLLWVALQTIQLFPIVLRRDKKFMRAVINEVSSHSKYQIRDDEDPALKMLKRWYNKFPLLTISRARTASLFAYGIDFCICLVVYPPVKGSVDRLMFILMTGQVSKIDWANVVLLLLTIFSVEILVRMLFWLAQVKHYLTLSKQEA